MDTWTKVPVGLQAERWRTIQPERTVLVIVHTVTAATRLLDILPIFEADLRVQVVFTTPGHSAVRAGVDALLTDLGAAVVPWAQALQTRFDLAIAAAHSGNLHEVNAPLVLLSHGIGYTKNSAGSRVPGPGSRAPRATYGLSPQWLLHDGQPYAAAIALSHAADQQRLVDSVPQAVDSAVVIGDPCYDRIIASAHRREHYRRSFGVTERQRLITVSSTWWQHSLFGTWPEFFRQLLAELDLDRYRVAAVLHPHIWFGHGSWQVHSWLADCVRAGLILLPPQEGWRAALIAADLVIGDHGAVTTYATAVDKPVALAAFPAADVAAGSPVAVLGNTAPRLRPDRPLTGQIDDIIEDFRTGQWKDIADMITSAAGEALPRLRQLAYRLMRLPEPAHAPPLHLLPAVNTAPRPAVSATFVTSEVKNDSVRLVRRPADVRSGLPTAAPVPTGAHLVCHADHPVPTLLQNASVVFRMEEEGAFGDPADLLAQHPGCALAALVGKNRCLVTRQEGGTFEVISGTDLPADALASTAYVVPRPGVVTVELGGVRHEVRIAAS